MSRPMRIEEAAAYLGFSPDSLHNMARQGKIPSYHPTKKCTYFKQEELEAYAFRNRQAEDWEIVDQADSILNGRER